MNWTNPKMHRPLILTFLGIVTGILSVYLSDLQEKKQALIQLASYNPAADDVIAFPLSRNPFRSLAEDDYFGFRNSPETFAKLADVTDTIASIEQRLEAFLPDVEKVIWDKKTLSSLAYYSQKVVISERLLDSLHTARRLYFQRFSNILKLTLWPVSIDIPDVTHRAVVEMEFDTIQSLLDRMKAAEDQDRGHLAIGNGILDLRNPTSFELSIALAGLRWRRYELESAYLKIVRRNREKWIESVVEKMMAQRHSRNE